MVTAGGAGTTRGGPCGDIITVVPDNNMSLIAPRAAFPFGWAFYYSGDHEGSQLEVPGARSFYLRNDSGAARSYLDLVKVANGVTIYDQSNPSHHGLCIYPFWWTR